VGAGAGDDTAAAAVAARVRAVDDGSGADGHLQLSFLTELLLLAEEARCWGLVAVVVEAVLRQLE
jgi:hypothetical protein